MSFEISRTPTLIGTGSRHRCVGFTLRPTATSLAQEGSQGMLWHHPDKPLQPLRLFICNRVCDVEATVESVFETNAGYGPLRNRAWVFQKRTLSRRILHFTTAGLRWGSNSISTFEQGLSSDCGAPKKTMCPCFFRIPSKILFLIKIQNPLKSQ